MSRASRTALAGNIIVAYVGTVVLRDSGAISELARLDTWRAKTTNRAPDDFPLLRRADRHRAVDMLHKLVALGETA
jgi:hypothetical protein